MAFKIDRRYIIAQDSRPRTRPLSNVPDAEVLLICHHAYAYTMAQIIATFESTARTVNANLVIAPLQRGVDDYKVWETADMNLTRAYTTASSKDDIAVTFEMANMSLSPPYPVGDSAKAILVDLIVYMHERFGMPITRYNVTCHREVYQRGWGSYATACPGDDLHGYLDIAVAEARRIVAGGGSGPAGGGGETPIEEEEYAMARNAGVYWKRANGSFEYMIFNTESGFRANHSGVTGDYNNNLATAFDTRNWALITEAHAKVFISSLDAVRASKASGDVKVTLPTVEVPQGGGA